MGPPGIVVADGITGIVVADGIIVAECMVMRSYS